MNYWVKYIPISAWSSCWQGKVQVPWRWATCSFKSFLSNFLGFLWTSIQFLGNRYSSLLAMIKKRINLKFAFILHWATSLYGERIMESLIEYTFYYFHFSVCILFWIIEKLWFATFNLYFLIAGLSANIPRLSKSLSYHITWKFCLPIN